MAHQKIEWPYMHSTTGVCLRLYVAVLCGTAFGQSKSDDHAKPITVCELLRDAHKYRGKTLAVLGRLDCGHSLIDNPCFLAEDQCEPTSATAGNVLPDKVAIVSWEQGMPKPPAVFPQINQTTLIQKLSLVRKATKLGLHKEPQFKTAGRTFTFSHFADTKDTWGIAYGRVFSTANLKSENFDGAPVVLITGVGIRSLNDEDYPNQ